MASVKTSSKRPKSQNKVDLHEQKGQLIFEYVLLLVLVATIGMLLIQLLVGQGGIAQGEPGGIIVQKWMAIVDTVSKDLPDN